jgi:hypothetical protein
MTLKEAIILFVFPGAVMALAFWLCGGSFGY